MRGPRHHVTDLVGARQMLVHSHHRWDADGPESLRRFVRFAHNRNVLVVEPALFLADARRSSIALVQPQPRLVPRFHRAIPRLPAPYREHEAATHIAVRNLVLDLISVGGALAHDVVYEHSRQHCGEHSGDRLQKYLLDRADVVIFGERSEPVVGAPSADFSRSVDAVIAAAITAAIAGPRRHTHR